MADTKHFRDLEEKHADTIQYIQNLQEMEKYMFKNLQTMSSGNDQSALEQEMIVNKINELKNIRLGLLQQLSSTYKDKQHELASERDDLSDKLLQIGIVDSELKAAEQNINVITNENNNKRRMVELYQYQKKRYNAYTDVLKYVVYGCLVILVLGILMKKQVTPFVSNHIYSSLIILTIIVTVILIVQKIYDISTRNNMDFDQYDFYFNPSMARPGYETVMQHDEEFFRKLGKESGATKNMIHLDNNTNLISSLSKDIGNGTAAGAGKSVGIINAPDATAKAQHGSSVVMPTQSSKESFASYN